MILYIDGYRTQNKALVESLTNAAYFYVYKLLGGRLARHISLDIKLTKDLKEKEDAFGFCHIVGELNKPREFCIELDASTKHSFSQILIWLAHECVHLKQFARGELFDYFTGGVQWKTKRFKERMNYNDQPWEKEAYRLESKLYKEFEEVYNA